MYIYTHTHYLCTGVGGGGLMRSPTYWTRRCSGRWAFKSVDNKIERERCIYMCIYIYIYVYMHTHISTYMYIDVDNKIIA